MNIKIINFLILTTFLFCLVSFAESIILNSGQVFDGKIISEDEESVTVQFYSTNLTFYKEEIKEIKKNNNVEAIQNKKNEESKLIKNTEKTFETKKKPQRTIQRPSSVSSSSSSLDQFLTKITETENELNLTLESLLSLLSKSEIKGSSKATIEIILEVIDYIEQATNRVKAFKAPPSGRVLKEKMLVYYERMVAYQSTLLQNIAKGDSNVTQNYAQVALNDLEKAESDFTDELQNVAAMVQNRKITSQNNSAGSINLPESIAGEDKQLLLYKQEYQLLIKQLEELVQLNEALKNESQLLIEENRELQDQLINFLQKGLPHMNNAQKRDFLRYLNE